MIKLSTGAAAVMALAVSAFSTVDASTAPPLLTGTYFAWVTENVPAGCKILGSTETKGPLEFGRTEYLVGIGGKGACPRYLTFNKRHRVHSYRAYSVERFVFRAFNAKGSYRLILRTKPAGYTARTVRRD